MALHLRFSHRMEPLLEGLDDLLGERWTAFEHPPRIVVPSPSVARWLKLRLCERRGPLVGLETSTLEATLWKALAPERNDRLLRVPVLQQALLAVLSPELLEEPAFESVRRFLRPSGTLDPRRKVQFAHELARLFLEYEYNRPSVWNDGWAVPGLDHRWPDAPYFSPQDDNPTETWQRRLHGLVFAPEGPLGNDESVRYLGLPRLHRLRHEEGWAPVGEPLILFGIDKVSHFHRNMLLELARTSDLHVYLQNPCSAFWEDLDTSRRRPRGRRRAEAIASLRFHRDATTDEWQAESLSDRCYPSATTDPLLLERWGRTARENIALWCQAADYDFEDSGDDVAPPGTLLGTVQEALRQRHPGPRIEPLPLSSGRIASGEQDIDGSILLLESPDRGREMEAMRNQMLSWLSEDPSRTVSDIVVHLPDPSRHRVEIERVFGGFESSDPGHLPWTMLGVPSSESLWARGALSLLHLACGTFDRPGVFALLRNGLCRRKLGIDEATVALWEEWSEGTGMIRGWDAAERAAEGCPTSLHTFRAGLQRLLLAPLAGREGVPLPGIESALPPWRDFDSTDPDRLERFCATLERLHADCERLRRGNAVPSRAVRELLELLDAWLDPADQSAEAGVRRSLHDALEGVRLRDGNPMGIVEMTEIVQNLVEGELPGSSRAWTGAITFAPLRAGNVLPHGLVLIPGLDADAFPGERGASALDLLSKRRIVGDPDLVSDNRHAFLLALLSCRDRLVLSWRACDIQKDERKDPSPVVLEFEEALRRGFLDRTLRRRVRLLEREAARSATELDDPAWDPLASGAGSPAPLGVIPPPKATATGSIPRIPSSRLKEFLLDSWKYRIEKDLDATEEELPDTVGKTDEVLDSSPLLRANIRRDLFPRLVREAWDGKDAPALARLASESHGRSLWNSDAPEGAQAREERRALETWATELHARAARLRSMYPRHRLETGCDLGLRTPGQPSEIAVPSRDGRRVLLSARLPAVLVAPDATGTSILLCPAKPSSKKPWYEFRRRVEPLLWALLAQRASGLETRVLMVPTETGMDKEEFLEPLPDTAIDSWLPDVLEDMLAQRCEFLPANIVVEKRTADLDDLREALEDSTWTPPLQSLLDPSLPGEDEGDASILRGLVERRLGPFLRLEETESDKTEDAA